MAITSARTGFLYSIGVYRTSSWLYVKCLNYFSLNKLLNKSSTIKGFYIDLLNKI